MTAPSAIIGVAQALLKDLPSIKVVLVNPSKKAFFNIAASRIFADSNAFKPDQYFLSIEDSFKKYDSSAFELIECRVGAVDAAGKAVTIEDTTASALGRESAVVPFKPPNTGDMELMVQKAQEDIADAQTILIAGGGPVGVEFAGELWEAFQGRTGGKITLVSQSSRLLPMLKESACRTAQDLLQKNNISDNSTKKWSAVLDDGHEIICDMFISTTGVLPNNSFIPTEYLTEDAWVKVDAEFRVIGGTGDPDRYIYAIGDITAHADRLASKIPKQIPVVTSNIKADVVGHGARAKYKTKGSLMMMVPIGGSGGTGQLFSWVPWSWFVRKMKGKDYFISQATRLMGVK
ncbi:uncharacterized protein P174DRAFT_513911 [Aspergillus novofumigatus IBT 16806]|uniref:FAD/NAD(P)-binding domain-containing protein n=1 Tax=Aspergillus novofumigatus (strain IBT 16806) TaxID=1392255 RepID=A0A2I1C185_ASPN1|nr:uncharacterized protein P174DRAFT_513911 [Aspergillus novofumigatus IBT 16806]PKX91398.1 hypothetical protein P174DRAFT_513911 [Aspergillus novofumigatus IBT 16806]